MKNIEILAPAGSESCFIAAIDARADAIYCGLENFSARMRADNFNIKRFGELIQLAHKNNIKVYSAFNTLVKQDEIKLALKNLAFLEEAGIDAVIVQDLGIAKLARKFFPSLKLHASTQMSVCNSYGAKYAKELGFSRVVLARELSRQTIKEISQKTKIELEIFVHGALCFSVSGMCLMSSFIGGLSANRGYCTQCCRRQWSYNKHKGFYISPKDLDLSTEICAIKNLNIASIKIEGRMKDAQYVHKVVSAYRALLCSDNKDDSHQGKISDLARPKTTFNFIKPACDILDGAHKNLGEPIGKIKIIKDRLIFIESKIEINDGDTLRILDNQNDRSYKINVLNPIKVDDGYHIKADTENLRDGFEALKIADGKYAEKLQQILLRYKNTTPLSPSIFSPDKTKIEQIASIKHVNQKSNKEPAKIFIKIDNAKWLNFIDSKKYIAVLMLSPQNFSAAERFQYFDLPAFMDENDLIKYQDKIDKLVATGKNNFFINNIGHFEFFKNKKVNLFGGVFLYGLNEYAISSFFDNGIKKFMICLEDDIKNISSLAKTKFISNGIFYLSGFPVLAISKMTLPKIFTHMTEPQTIDSTRDSFQIISNEQTSAIIPKYPIMLFDKMQYLMRLGINNFFIDLSFIAPNENYIKTLLSAASGKLSLKNSNAFNFERGLK
jgi:putative protease